MADFTKGTWQLDTSTGLIQSDNNTIGSVFGATEHNQSQNTQEVMANARLICAAPKMFHLLQLAFFDVNDKNLALEIDTLLKSIYIGD